MENILIIIWFLNYRLVPVLDEDYPSSKSDSSDQEDDKLSEIISIQQQPPPPSSTQLQQQQQNASNALGLMGTTVTSTTLSICTSELGGGGINTNISGIGCGVGGGDIGTVTGGNSENTLDTISTIQNAFPQPGSIERKRRKLPEIPKVRKRELLFFFCYLFEKNIV